MAKAMKRLGIECEDTRDQFGRERFIPLNINHLRYKYSHVVKPKFWYWRYSYYPTGELQVCEHSRSAHASRASLSDCRWQKRVLDCGPLTPRQCAGVLLSALDLHTLYLLDGSGGFGRAVRPGRISASCSQPPGGASASAPRCPCDRLPAIDHRILTRGCLSLRRIPVCPRYATQYRLERDYVAGKEGCGNEPPPKAPIWGIPRKKNS